MHDRWQQCIHQLSAELSEQAFRTWIKPLVMVGHDLDRHRVRLGAPNAVKADVVRKQYGQLIRQVVRDCFQDDDLGVQIEVFPGSPAPARQRYGNADATDVSGSGGQVDPSRIGRDNPESHVVFVEDDVDVIPTAESARRAADSGTGGPSMRGAMQGATHDPLQDSTHDPLHDPAQGVVRDTAPFPTTAGAGADDTDRAAQGYALRQTGTTATARAATASRSGIGSASTNEPRGARQAVGAFPATQNIRGADDGSRLNLSLTFGNFVSGKANDFARAAALQVSERPGTTINPLFIHGGVGLGKTHLMQAVGNALRLTNPDARIRYVTASQFFQDMVSALRRESVDTFKRYYQSLDLLLIDDIQFLSEKKRSQEEFFYVFEALVARQRQIIITCDTYPKELSQMDDRLVSRFNSGLIVAIEPPELEMRVAILQRKAEAARVRVPPEVCYFVAKHIRQNVRELEGALQRIIHYAAFRSAAIDLDQVKEALKDILSFNRGQISIELIQRTVADYYKIKLADMYSKRRPAKIALPRQVAMYLCKELTQKSLPEIGDAFGGRDHTTVLHAVRKVAELRAHRAEFNHEIHVLEQTLREYL